MRKLLAIALLVFAFVPGIAAGKSLRVGGKNFTEQMLLASMTSQYLSHHGYKVDLKTGLGTLLMRQALVENQLDVVWDYTGTALIVYHHHQEKLTGQASYEMAKKLDEPNDLIWLNPSEVDNGYALTMQKEKAKELGIETVEDLATFIRKRQQEHPQVKNLFAVDFEFASRPDGLRPFQKTYEFEFKRRDVKQMDPGLVYTALRNGQVLVGLAFASDGRIDGFDLQVIKDNRNFFPAYYVTAVVRKEVLDADPELATYLNNIASKLDTPIMTELNRRVDVDHESVDRVALDFLKKQGLLP